jgi:IstB-like ATP binding protein
MIFTTNKPLNDWGKVLHDEDMAATILDRMLERGRFLRLARPSGEGLHEVLPGVPEYRLCQNVDFHPSPYPSGTFSIW